MNPNLSMTDVLSSLEIQIAHHREQEALHAEREELHRERRVAHAAELEQLTRCLESFRATAAMATDLAARALPAPPAAPAEPPLPETLTRGRRFRTAKIVERVVARKGPQERFGPRAIAAEVNQRFGEQLGRQVNERQVSVALRWLAESQRIVRLERGRPFWEAQYARHA